MYMEAGDSINSPSCIELCNKLFNKALEMEDVMGQSLSFTMKAYYYGLKGDIDGIKSVLTETQNCNTMKITYRYVIWKQYISYLLMLDRTHDAYKEIELMQKDALKENVENGIVKAYFMYAYYFIQLKNIPAALENFDKGFKIAKENYRLFDPMEVANYSGLLQEEGELEKAIYYVKLGMTYPNKAEALMFPLHVRLLNIYSDPSYTGDKKNAYKAKMDADSVCRRIPKLEESIDRFYRTALFHYYLYVDKNTIAARKYLKAFDSDSIALFESKAALEQQEKNYKEAYNSASTALTLYKKQQKESQSDVQKGYSLQNSLNEALRERDQLQLDNERLSLEKSRQEQRWKWALTIIALILIAVLFSIYALIQRQKKRLLCLERDSAKNAEETKTQFFQNMSHEIRTPLNAIIGFSEIICDDSNEIDHSEREEYLNIIRSNADLLGTLVNDVLDISKLESGTYTVNLQDTPIKALCHTTLESVRTHTAPGVELKLASGNDDLILKTDSQRLQQVLINYLSNACKYTKAGSITLSYEEVILENNKNYIRFAVSDTGSGVPKGEEESCFNRFNMLDRNIKGTGLGLHICKLISNMLNGKVYVDTSYTDGARFVFDHPCKI